MAVPAWYGQESPGCSAAVILEAVRAKAVHGERQNVGDTVTPCEHLLPPRVGSDLPLFHEANFTVRIRAARNEGRADDATRKEEVRRLVG